MTAPRPRRPLLASLPLAAVALVATVAAAQTPVPRDTSAGRDVVAVAGMAVLSARAAENRALISALVAAYYPAVLQPNSDIGRIVFVLDSSDAYVTSAAVKVVGTAESAPSQDPRQVNGVMLRATAAPRLTEAPAYLDLTRYGLGVIDRSVVRGTAFSSYHAGVLAPNAGALDVYIVRLKT